MHASSPDGVNTTAAMLCHMNHVASESLTAYLHNCPGCPFNREMFWCQSCSPYGDPWLWGILQGVKLFYRVLQSMLKAEHDRTGRSDFGSLLSSASFHKCLAACCFEVVIASYRMVSQVDRHRQTQCVLL